MWATLRGAVPAIAALVVAAITMFFVYPLGYGPFGWLSLGIPISAFIITSMILARTMRTRDEEVPNISSEDGRDTAIGKLTYRKYRDHYRNARSSLNVLLTLTICCLGIIVFARYFLVVDQVWSGQASASTSLNSPYCEELSNYSRSAMFINNEGTPNERYDAYVKSCDEARAAMRADLNLAPNSGENVETQAFWPVLLLRASVLAFMLFVMWFFIRNYQYETAIANRYFTLLAGMMASPSTAAAVESSRRAFDTGDIKFGAVKADGIMQMVSLPGDLLEAMISRVRAGGAATSVSQPPENSSGAVGDVTIEPTSPARRQVRGPAARERSSPTAS